MWETFVNQSIVSISQVLQTAQFFAFAVKEHLSIVTVIDGVLVFALLWWLYRSLRRTDLIKILPKVFLLLMLMLAARILSLWVLFYLSAGLLVIVLIALGALYAPEIKRVLEANHKLPGGARAGRSLPSTGEIATTIKIIVESFAILSKARKPALVVIEKSKAISRLVEPSAKMQTRLTIEALIDFFGNGSDLSSGAAVISGHNIIGAGSKLGTKKKRLLFNADDPVLKRVAKEFDAVLVISHKTSGEIVVIAGDHTYKHLSAKDLPQVLQTVLVYSS